MSAERQLSEFPSEVFESSVLRELDGVSREAIIASARVLDVEADVDFYQDGDASESFFVVLRGVVELRTIRSGEQETSMLRIARAGDTFGEEATLPGLARRATATTTSPSSVVEVPIAVFRRAVGRSSGSREAERERRYLHHSVTRDIVHASALGRDLGDEYLDVLLDAAELRRVARGAHIYDIGDEAEAFYLVAEGLVQLQSEDDGTVSILAYVSRGGSFGGEEVVGSSARRTAAVACGDTWCIRIPAEPFRYVAEGNPQAVTRLRRVADEDESRSLQANQQVFGDLYRMQTARSLLVIDQDSCVRCGHCAWSCSEVHGNRRLVRRGDTVLVSLARTHSKENEATTLSLPNTCQHCKNAACMVDCPTGAIGRDAGGEVVIREDLCTGCGSCAKACPWENISIAPRNGALSLSPNIAVKCDLCSGYDAPACVQGCPTEAIFRIEPQRDIAELRQNLTSESRGVMLRRPRIGNITVFTVLLALGIVGVLGLIGLGFAMHRAGTWYPSIHTGVAAGVCMSILAGYVIPKRYVRLWMRKASAASAVAKPSAQSRSRMKPLLAIHLAVGLLACAAAMAHAGLRVPSTPAGALNLAFWIAIATGCVGTALYVAAPRRLTKLERTSALPEDLVGRRRELLEQLFRQSSGRDELIKAITAKVLVPYARAPLGSLRLLLSGRTIEQERNRLRERIEVMLESRGADRLKGLDRLIETVVDLRAAPSRRALTASLRGWLPLHILAVAMASGLLIVHVALVIVL